MDPCIVQQLQAKPLARRLRLDFPTQRRHPHGRLFQLRQKFRDSRRYLGLYDRDELIAHELCHVGRMMYQEPKYEEVLAYRTSKSTFRRWFGPIVQSSWESTLFLVILILIMVVDFSLASFHQTQAFEIAMWAKAIPALLIFLALGRLCWRHNRFSKCLSNLKDTVGAEAKANAVIYRLQDREIAAFAGMGPDAIRRYAAEIAGKSLRWRVIASAYFPQEKVEEEH